MFASIPPNLVSVLRIFFFPVLFVALAGCGVKPSINASTSAPSIPNPSSNPVAHTVVLTWADSTSDNVVGYNIYRSTVSAGPFAKITSSPATGTSYTDTAVQASTTYYYVATAVDADGQESSYSNTANAVVS